MNHLEPSPADRRLRLLLLLPHVPAPGARAGGARSTAHLITELSKHHEVAVLCLRRPFDSPIDEELRRACAAFEAVDVDPVAARRGANPLQRLRLRMATLVRTPAWVACTASPAYRERLQSLLVRWCPDIVHLGYHVMGQYARDLDGCDAPRVLTEHEPPVPAAREAVRGLRGLARIRAVLEAQAWARYERRIFRETDAVVVFTERDRRALAPLAGETPLVRIPLGVAIPASPLDPCGVSPPQVLFVGNFLHRPNVEAALRLMRSIFPVVESARPGTRLLVVGPEPTAEMQALAGGATSVTGAVDDVRPYLDAAAVVVAPLHTGGGMRVKVMEALAAGKAVVATPLAAEGLHLTGGRELLLAERDDEFASRLIALLDDPLARVALATRAREWACAHLGWNQSIAAYNALHEQLLRTAPAHRRSAPDRRRGVLLSARPIAGTRTPV